MVQRKPKGDAHALLGDFLAGVPKPRFTEHQRGEFDFQPWAAGRIFFVSGLEPLFMAQREGSLRRRFSLSGELTPLKEPWHVSGRSSFDSKFRHLIL